MSTVTPVTVRCRACGADVAGEVVLLGNLDRRGRFADRVLEGTFNTVRCDGCGHRALVERAFGLVSFAEQRWLIGYPLWAEQHWRDLAHAAVRQFHRNRCAMPVWLRTDPAGWAVRVVFGHDQLREKILIWRAGLDETAVEAAKLALVAADPRRYEARIWLWDAVGDELRWVIAWKPGEPTRLVTDRRVLDAPLPEGFLREELLADAFVNARRWIVKPVGADPLQFDLDGRGWVEGGGAVLRTPFVDPRE